MSRDTTAGTAYNFDTVLSWDSSRLRQMRARMDHYRATQPFTAATAYAVQRLDTGRVLDIGPGAGNDIEAFQARGQTAIGLDITPGLRLGNWPLVVGSATAAPFRDSSFHGILLNRVLHHMREPVQLLSEVARLLTPAGEAVAIWPDRQATQASDPDVGETLRALFAVPGLETANPTTLNQLTSWLKPSGLTLVEQQLFSQRLEGTDALGYAYGGIRRGEQKRTMAEQVRPGSIAQLEEFAEHLSAGNGWVDLGLRAACLARAEA